MPKGSNFAGPFKGLPSEGGVIASIACPPCSDDISTRYVDLKVDGHGWIYASCTGTEGCRSKREGKTIKSAAFLIAQAVKWRAGAKKPAYEIAGLTKSVTPEPVPEPTPAPAPEPIPETIPEPVPEPALKPKPKKTRSVMGLIMGTE